ncbi:hypothetical protein [Flavobacterium rhizosphaerae]|uniref:Gliding motility-associated lipoprotein GldH n=1 Tax=Flavobacterium rhizosphaerae TaxID=3163298 RepID=A0ABW8YZ89_9FLAO
MKKILLLFATISLFSLTACSNDDDNNNYYPGTDIRSEVFEVDHVNFTANGDYTVTIPLNPRINNEDVILVYRLSGSDQGNDIWEQIPTTYPLAEGTVNYYTDFSVNSVSIYFDADFDAMLRQDFSLDQVFRIVIIPGYFSQTLDTSNYDAVMSALQQQGVKEQHIEIQ